MATITAYLSNGEKLVNEEIDSTWFEENPELKITAIESLILNSNLDWTSIVASHDSLIDLLATFEDAHQTYDEAVYFAWIKAHCYKKIKVSDYISAIESAYCTVIKTNAEDAKIEFAQDKINSQIEEMKYAISQISKYRDEKVILESGIKAVQEFASSEKYAKDLFGDNGTNLIFEIENDSYIFHRD